MVCQYHLKPPKVAKVARFINTLKRPRRVSFVRLDAAFEEADNARWMPSLGRNRPSDGFQTRRDPGSCAWSILKRWEVWQAEWIFDEEYPLMKQLCNMRWITSLTANSPLSFSCSFILHAEVRQRMSLSDSVPCTGCAPLKNKSGHQTLVLVNCWRFQQVCWNRTEQEHGRFRR